jgi:hypothetical protein
MTGSATKQSSFLLAEKLGCFASLAMTVLLPAVSRPGKIQFTEGLRHCR